MCAKLGEISISVIVAGMMVLVTRCDEKAAVDSNDGSDVHGAWGVT